MSLSYQILGKPFEDNALYVEVRPGEQIQRILFDCGQRCLDALRPSTLLNIDHLCFSHFHMDHISGFDAFLRMNYNRERKPVHLWGPQDALEVLHHRLLGVTWDLVKDQPGEWQISQITGEKIATNKYFTREGFAQSHSLKGRSFYGLIVEQDNYTIEARIMQHRVPSLAYRVSEPKQYNINPEELQQRNLEPGQWLETVKDFSREDGEQIAVNDKLYSLGQLRQWLLVKHEGESITYATDLVYEESSIQLLIEMISGCDTFVCESTYAGEDAELAAKHYHLTASQAAQIAADAGVGKLILFHISKRYSREGSQRFLEEARTIFPETYFPEHWTFQEVHADKADEPDVL